MAALKERARRLWTARPEFEDHDPLCPEQLLVSCKGSSGAALLDPFGRSHALDRVAFIGRSPGLGIRILVPYISRRHAVLFETPEGEWFIEDLNSNNGTLVDEEAVHGPRKLGPMENLCFAGIPFVFVASADRLPVAQSMKQQTVSLPSNKNAPMAVMHGADEGGRITDCEGRSVDLTLAQYELFELLLTRALEDGTGFVTTREIVKGISWDCRYPDSNHVKQLVRRARKTIDRASLELVIDAKRGSGYRLVVPD